MTHGGHVAVVHQPHRITRQASVPGESMRAPDGAVTRAPPIECHSLTVDHHPKHMLRAGHVHALDTIWANIGGDAAHRTLGQGECRTDRLEGFCIEPAQGCHALSVEAEVLGEQRAIAQGQETVVTAVDEGTLVLDVEVVGVETVQVRPVHGIDRPVRMGEDRPAPDMTPARQFWRQSQCLERHWIELLDPAKRRRSAEGRHRASHVPLPRVASDGHDVPPSGATSGHPRRSGGSVEPTGRRLLSTVAAAFNRPRRRPVPRGGGGPVSGEHRRTLGEATERSTDLRTSRR